MAIQTVNPVAKKEKPNKLLTALNIGMGVANTASSLDKLTGNKFSDFLKKRPEMAK